MKHSGSKLTIRLDLRFKCRRLLPISNSVLDGSDSIWLLARFKSCSLSSPVNHRLFTDDILLWDRSSFLRFRWTLWPLLLIVSSVNLFRLKSRYSRDERRKSSVEFILLKRLRDMSRTFNAAGSPGGTVENPLLEQLAESSSSEQLQITADGHILDSANTGFHSVQMVPTKTNIKTTTYDVPIAGDIFHYSRKWIKALPGTSKQADFFRFILHRWRHSVSRHR